MTYLASPQTRMTLTDTEKQTFQLERWRSVAAGITETANSTFIGLVANKYFAASQFTKGALMTNTSIGLLLSPFILYYCSKRNWTAGEGIRWFSLLAAFCSLLAGIPVLSCFALGTLFAYIFAAGVAPLYLSIYERNYGEAIRGRLFAKNYFLRIIANISFGLLAGWLLKKDIRLFPLVFSVYALCFALSARFVGKMPAVPLAASTEAPWHNLRYIKEDVRFRWTLVSWMLLGFANLAMFPLRTEYLANKNYLDLDEFNVALYTSALPNAARLVFNPIWGRLFDKMNFFNLRVLLNVGFMLGFLSFFAASSRQDHVGLIIGAVLFGISNSGADLVWNLWVTKIAPPDRTAAYMSIHSFLTGIRGVVAPLLAFSLTSTIPIKQMAYFCASLVVLASYLLLREKRLRPL
jgi:MFS family permease